MVSEVRLKLPKFDTNLAISLCSCQTYHELRKEVVIFTPNIVGKCSFSRYGMHASCSAISGVRYSQFTLLVAFYRARDYSCFGIYRHSFAVQGHSTASLVTFLSIMGETGNDLPPLESNPGRSSRESAFSGEGTLNLVSRLLALKKKTYWNVAMQII